MWNVKFPRTHVSFLVNSSINYELSNCTSADAFAVEDEWVLDEREMKMKLTRIHKKARSQIFVPVQSTVPIPFEYLDSQRETSFDFFDGSKDSQVDDWKSTLGKAQHRTEKQWKGRTVFKILPGGLERRLTKISVRSTGPNRRGNPEDQITGNSSSSGAKKFQAPTSRIRKKTEGTPVAPPGREKVGSGPSGSEPKPFSMSDLEDDEKDQQKSEMPKMADLFPDEPVQAPGREDTEPRRIDLPLPGQEVSQATPAFKKMLERLRNEVELYKLHVKHYHMSSTQFRRRTSMLGLPDDIYEKYDRILKGCKVCNTSVPSPPRARISGLRASSFGDLVFVDHAEINLGQKSYLVLLMLDGATNLLWATAQATLDSSETLNAFRNWTEENNCIPKGVVGDTAFFTDVFMDYYKFHGITPYPCGSRTPWPNRAETAVRLFKRSWALMAKSLVEEDIMEKVTVRQAVKKVVWARNCRFGLLAT